MEGILSIFWLIGCSTVLPIIIIWLVTRKQINETNKRTEIIMSALEKNRVNVKSRLIKLVLLPLWYGNKDIIRDTLS